MTVVLDASAVSTLAVAGWLTDLESHAPIAPTLMWSEALASIRQSRWRGEISAETERRAVENLLTAQISRRSSDEVYRRAIRLANDLGWAKTYDAEYVVVAQLEEAPLVTLDGRLRRRVDSVVEVFDPGDLLR